MIGADPVLGEVIWIVAVLEAQVPESDWIVPVSCAPLAAITKTVCPAKKGEVPVVERLSIETVATIPTSKTSKPTVASEFRPRAEPTLLFPWNILLPVDISSDHPRGRPRDSPGILNPK